MEYQVEPELKHYSTWIGVTQELEIADFKNLATGVYDKIIIDHYGIDAFIEKKIKSHFNCELIVITDIYDFTHYCDTFINYTCQDIEQARSININNETCFKIGYDNLILNKLFREPASKKVYFRNKIKNIVITMGGCDPMNYTQKIIDIISMYVKKNNINVKVIIGKSNINKINTEYSVLNNISYVEMINLYKETDLVIGSCSITAFERLILNVPQICLKIIENLETINDVKLNITTLPNLMNNIQKFSNSLTTPSPIH